MLWLDGQKAGVLGAFLHVYMPQIAWKLEILSYFKQGGGMILAASRWILFHLRPVRILSFYFGFPHSLSNRGESLRANHSKNP